MLCFQLLSAESPCGNEESLELVVVDVDGVLSLVSFNDALVNGVLSVLGTYGDQAVVAVVSVLALLVDRVVCGKAAVEGVVAVDDCEVNVLDNGINEVCVYLDELYRYCVVGDVEAPASALMVKKPALSRSFSALPSLVTSFGTAILRVSVEASALSMVRSLAV